MLWLCLCLQFCFFFFYLSQLFCISISLVLLSFVLIDFFFFFSFPFYILYCIFPGGGHGNPLQYSCLENPHGQRSLAGYTPWDRKGHDCSDLAPTHISLSFPSGPRSHLVLFTCSMATFKQQVHDDETGLLQKARQATQQLD